MRDPAILLTAIRLSAVAKKRSSDEWWISIDVHDGFSLPELNHVLREEVAPTQQVLAVDARCEVCEVAKERKKPVSEL